MVCSRFLPALTLALGAAIALGCARSPANSAGASPATAPRPAGDGRIAQAAGSPAPVARTLPSARAEFVDAAGERIGEAHLQETPNGVLIRLNVARLPAGMHGFHIHETGKCTPTFDAAGDHVNPTGREHGFENERGPHAGDLPNLHVPDTGRLVADVLARDVTLEPGRPGSLLDEDGSALIIHERPDDYRSNPSGEAGARIACAVVTG